MAVTQKKKKKKSWVGLILRLFTYILLIFLLTGFFARYISPKTYWFPAFFGLLFPYLYVLIFIIFLLWLLFKKRIALYIFIVLAICSTLFFRFFNIFPVSFSEGDDSLKFSIISFNVRTFNRGNVFKDDDKWARRNAIIDFLIKESPDIICFQEVYSNTKGRYRTLDTIAEVNRAKHIHAEYSFTRNEHTFGIATLSAYPIIAKGTVDFEMPVKNMCIYTDIVIKEDTFRIYNAHFSSIGLSEEDKMFVDHIAALEIDEGTPIVAEKSLRNIASRLKKAFLNRASQVEVVISSIEKSPYPVVFCTDLNDTPASYAYQKIRSRLNDSFLKSGSGIGETYNMLLPYIRIDYIFYSKILNPKGFKTHHVDLSDHYPISVTFYKP